MGEEADMAKERTFVMVKPDGVMRGLVGEVISRLERAGLKLVAIKMVWPTKEKVAGFYPSSEEWLRSVGEKSMKGYEKLGIDIAKEMGTSDPVEIGKIIKGWLVKYVSSGPCVAMVWEGNRAIEKVRAIVGFTEPFSAAPGTIRGDLSPDSFEWANREFRSLFNIIHASGNKEEAEHEISYWFSEEEIFSYENAAELVWKKIKS